MSDVRAEVVAEAGGEEAVARARERSQAYIDGENGACPALWGTDNGEDFVVHGYRDRRPERLTQLGPPEDGTAVVVPAGVPEESACVLAAVQTVDAPPSPGESQ